MSVNKLRYNLNKFGYGDSTTVPGKEPHLDSSEGVSPSVSLQHPDYLTDSIRSSDSDVLNDDLASPVKHKMVAIDVSQNKRFSHKLLPVQSPEFDNVMDQVRNCHW